MINKKNLVPSGSDYLSYDDTYYTFTWAELIDQNINNIIYHQARIDELYTFLDNIPDLTGYYTKDQLDILLLEKANVSDVYTTTEIDNMLIDYIDVEQYDNDIEELQTDVVDNQNHITTNTNDIADIQTNLGTLNDNVATNTTNIATNTADITTIKDELTASFETNGEYQHIGGELDNSTIYRPDLIEVQPLNSTFVNVQLEPNLFTAVIAGRAIFTNVYDNITVDSDLTLTFRIVKNDVTFKEINKELLAGTTYGTTIVGALDLQENDNIYVEYEITEGTGTITAASNTTFIIQYKSITDISVVKSSQIINDSDDLPNNGLNPTLVSLQQQIDSLKLAIGTIVLSPTAPTYGTWIDLGEILEGQSVIGGNTNIGAVKSHNHQTTTALYWGNADDKTQIEFFTKITGYDSDGNLKDVRSGTDEENLINNSNLFTAKTGSTENRAWGLGLGLGLHAWKRTE